MNPLSLFGALLGFAILPFTLRNVTPGRLAAVFALGIIHIGATALYHDFSITNSADASFYYNGGEFFRQFPWTALSTIFVGHLTQWIKHYLGASYFDAFMLFQAVGFWGLMILMRTFHEIYAKLQQPDPGYSLYLLFFPSLHFWTVAIGKDAPLFFAVSLCVWSLLGIRKRYLFFVLGLAVMVLFRAHIALFTALALAIAALIHTQLHAGQKLLVLAAALGGAAIFVGTVETSLQVDVTDPASIARFLEARSSAELADTGGSSIARASYPMRLLSLLFRPLFFDVNSVMGVVASFENIGSLLLFGYLFMHRHEMGQLAKRVFFIRFAVIYVVLLVALLAFFNYNVGLGLRERVMVIPPLFCIFLAVHAYARARRNMVAPPAQRPRPGLAVPADQHPAR